MTPPGTSLRPATDPPCLDPRAGYGATISDQTRSHPLYHAYRKDSSKTMRTDRAVATHTAWTHASRPSTLTHGAKCMHNARARNIDQVSRGHQRSPSCDEAYRMHAPFEHRRPSPQITSRIDGSRHELDIKARSNYERSRGAFYNRHILYAGRSSA